MLIETEETPNPNTLKFLPGLPVSPQRAWQFEKPEEAEGKSPLALRLLKVIGVQRVFLGGEFISVTKSEDMDWAVVKPIVLGAINEHFASNSPVLTDTETQVTHDSGRSYDADTQQIVDEIKDLLDSRVRPAVAQDGGDIIFHDFDPDTGVVLLEMRGACHGCPSSTATLKTGVQSMLSHYIPEVKAVEAWQPEGPAPHHHHLH